MAYYQDNGSAGKLPTKAGVGLQNEGQGVETRTLRPKLSITAQWASTLGNQRSTRGVFAFIIGEA